MEEGEKPSYKFGCFDRFVQPFRIAQRSFDKIHDDFVIPLLMIAIEKYLSQNSEVQGNN